MKALPFRFVVSALVVSLASIAAYAQSAGQTQQKAAQEDEFLKGVYLPDTPNLVVPVALTQTYPKYTSDAMRAKIQGDVEVQAVVLADGTVDRVRITTSLDRAFGLDESAMTAAKQWRFKPAMLNGKPVPVAITLKLSFRLH